MDGNVAFIVLAIVAMAVVLAIGFSQRKRTPSTNTNDTVVIEPAQSHEPMPATKLFEAVKPASEPAPSHHVTGIPVGATGRRSGRHQPHTGWDDTPVHTATLEAVSAGASTDYGSSSSDFDGGSSSSSGSGSCD